MNLATYSANEGLQVARKEQVQFWLLMAALTVGLLVSVTLAVAIGPVQIPWRIVWSIAAYKVGLIPQGDWTMAQENIVWLIRFPRVLMGAVVGAGLASVGVAMQAVVRNPLADPYILGVSSGASVGAVLVLGFGFFAFAGMYAVPFGAFLGALFTFLVVFTLARSGGRLSPSRLILSGVACAYVFSGLTSFITLTSSNRELARSLMQWLLGSLAGADWMQLTLPATVLVLGTVYLTLHARSLNGMLMGDEAATTLGINVDKLRQRLFLIMSLLTGVIVAVSGAIGFIGLMIPHLVRMMVGSDHRRVLGVSVLVGAIFLIWVDVCARTLWAPVELPVGVITAILGGPFFVWMLYTQRKTMREVL